MWASETEAGFQTVNEIGDLLGVMGPAFYACTRSLDRIEFVRVHKWNVNTQRHFGIDCAEDFAHFIEDASGDPYAWRLLEDARAVANDTAPYEALRAKSDLFEKWARGLSGLSVKWAADAVVAALGPQPWMAAFHARLVDPDLAVDVRQRQTERLSKILGDTQ